MAKGINPRRTGRAIQWTRCTGECHQMVVAAAVDAQGVCRECRLAGLEQDQAARLIKVLEGKEN